MTEEGRFLIVEKELKAIPLPAIYKREGKECYYDTYRKKLIEITPEETVRQRVAAYFENECGVPKEMISLEVPMSYYVKGVSGRADIIVHAYDLENDCIYPVTIIECKKEDVLLTDNVVEQAMRYCDALGGKYIVITNGIEMKMFVYQDESNSYALLDEILPYKKMLSDDYVIPDFKTEKLIRLSMEELKDQKVLMDYNEQGTWIFGSDSSLEVRNFAVNFYQALLDVDHRLPAKKFKTFEMLEDFGQRFMNYGNAGGGHYFGFYRSFLVNDRLGETQIVSICIFGTDSNFRDENRGSYTSLVVSIDRFKTSHNSLQYNVDKYAKIHPDSGLMEFTHNGQIGSYKSADVVDKVKKYGDCLIVSDAGISLGVLHTDRLLYLDDKEASEFVYKLIEYALLREEVRRDKKNRDFH